MVVEEIKIHILCSVIFFKNSAVYMKVLRNVVQPDRSKMTIQFSAELLFACLITKERIHTLIMFNTDCFMYLSPPDIVICLQHLQRLRNYTTTYMSL